MTVCCEHNRCPDRPRRWLGRFRNRPWFCDQCGRLWVTVPKGGWDFQWWEWKDLTEPPDWLKPKPFPPVRLAPTVEDQTLTNKEVRHASWADAGPPIGLYPRKLPVHNHGPEEGAGLACPERRVGGRLVGACLDDGPSCANCDGRRCMSCVVREEHDQCRNDCLYCCRDVEL